MSLIDEKISKAIDVCKEMLIQRGCDIIDIEDNICNDIKIIAIKNNVKTCVFLSESVKFNVDRIKEYIYILNSNDMVQCIIIYIGTITSYVSKTIDLVKNLDIELFNIDDLQFNITKHSLQPVFEKMDTHESELFRKRWGKIPMMSVSDPISRFYKYKIGDVIKITRKNGIVTFRKVV